MSGISDWVFYLTAFIGGFALYHAYRFHRIHRRLIAEQEKADEQFRGPERMLLKAARQTTFNKIRNYALALLIYGVFMIVVSAIGFNT